MSLTGEDTIANKVQSSQYNTVSIIKAAIAILFSLTALEIDYRHDHRHPTKTLVHSKNKQLYTHLK